MSFLRQIVLYIYIYLSNNIYIYICKRVRFFLDIISPLNYYTIVLLLPLNHIYIYMKRDFSAFSAILNTNSSNYVMISPITNQGEANEKDIYLP